MWCSKHHAASPVKTGDFAEDPEDKQREDHGKTVCGAAMQPQYSLVM